MKEVFILLVVAFLASVIYTTGGVTKEVRNMEGKILKDADNNYYQVEGNVGDNVFLRKIDPQQLNKF